MIRSFGSKDTERLWRRERVRSLDPRIHRVALRMLRQVGSAESLEDLRVPPGNRLEALRGDRAGQHSIRINDQWRVCFIWTDAGPEEVEMLTTTDKDKIEPIHPGEPHGGLHQGIRYYSEQARGVDWLPPRRINEIVHCKRTITADTALRLAKYFGTSAEFWINLQGRYELDRAEDLAGKQIASITPLRVA